MDLTYRFQLKRLLNMKEKNSLIFVFTIVIWLVPSFAKAAQSSASAAAENPAAKIAHDSQAEGKPLSTQSESWRKKPPTLPAPRAFVMPNVVCYKLPNGLDVQLVQDHRVPFVTVEMGFKAGSTSEPKELLGLAGITADMMTEGTKTKRARK